LGDAVIPMHAQLQFRDLTLGYDRHPAVHHLNGSVLPGTLLALMGPNGAGKSTLLKGIVGALTPLAGRIERDGLHPRDIAYLPQIADIDRAIAAVGLTGFEGRAIATLSGGQMQRMLFARLLLQDARVIVLDEPFTA